MISVILFLHFIGVITVLSFVEDLKKKKPLMKAFRTNSKAFTNN